MKLSKLNPNLVQILSFIGFHLSASTFSFGGVAVGLAATVELAAE